MEPNISSESFAGGQAALQAPALPSTAPFESYIHEIVYALGRAFGFQAFNVNPDTYNVNPDTNPHHSGEEWVAGAVFVASDHLVHILAKNMYTRNMAEGDARHRFILSAWDLHGKIMQNYFKWCDHVNLPYRPSSQSEWFNKVEPFSDEACNMILSEVALSYLIWTEAHNLRYLPELLNFLYWTMRFSPNFEEAANVSQSSRGNIQPVPTDPEAIVANLRQYREDFRRTFWVQIMKLRDRWNNEGVEPTPKLISQYTGVGDNEAPILGEVIRNGDGGDFLDLIVQPIFNFLAIELDEKGGKQSIETINRVNYDDVNESMCNRGLVHRTLKKLKIDGGKTKNVNDAFDAIKRLPFDAESGEKDLDLSTAFWRKYSFAKTFRERRSYLQIFRMFWRMFTFHALMFHELLIIALYGVKDFDIKSCPEQVKNVINRANETETEGETDCENVSGFIAAHSSLLLTHCFLVVCERFSAGYLSLSVKDPSKKVKKRRSKMRKGYDDLEAADEAEGLTKKKEKKKKEKYPSIRIEGTPVGVFGEGLIWLVLLVIMVAVFVFQFLEPEKVGVAGMEKADFKLYWILVSGAYLVVNVAHAICSTRDGYQVSITSYFSLGFLRRFSIRGRPVNEVSPTSVLKVSWRVFFWNVLFWTITFILKGLFDYFLIIAPLAGGLEALSRESWLSSVFPSDKKILDTGVPLPEDGDFLLMIARAIPSFLITLIDTSVFYMIMAVIFGMTRGVVLLNLGVVGNFAEVQTEFRRAPKQWWQRCISPVGQTNIRENLLKQRFLLPEDQVEPEEENALKKAKKKKKDKKSKKDNGQQGPVPEDEAKHDVFSTTWNEIIDDLRLADLISNTERDLLKYTRLPWHESMYHNKMKPLIPPTFIFAGQMQKLVEIPKPTRAQIFLVEELRDWLLYLLVQTEIIDKDFADSMKNAFFLEEPFDRHHRICRRKLLTAVTEFLKSLAALSRVNPQLQDKWAAEVGKVRNAMESVLEEMYYEVEALGDHRRTKRLKIGAGYLKKNIELIKRFITHLKKNYVRKEAGDALDQKLSVLFKDEAEGSNAELTEEEDAGPGNRVPTSTYLKIINGFVKRLTTPRIVATPSGREARQFLTFFTTSLFNPQLLQPPSLVTMMSWTTLVPVFKEDIIYAMEHTETAVACGLDPKGNIGAVTDLMTDTDTRVSLLSYLRAVYPKDWMNFLERMKDRFGIEYEKPEDLTGVEFCQGGEFYKHQQELLLWASYRGQLLSRTVRGMMVYEKALKLIALLEHPQPDHMDDDDYQVAIEECVAAKFRCVIAAQVYGTNRKGSKLKEKWDARAIELLLDRNPTLRVSFIDEEKGDDHQTQWAVLIRGNQMGGDSSVEEIYRIRMPYNEVSGRGIVIGEGKPENQNHAICFAFGETLQTIDMNQDNFLLEAMKMRSLLQELKTPEFNPKRSPPKNCKDYSSRICRRLDRKYMKKPVLIGFREWIFSDKAGALGSFAAGTEFAFGTILQRVMTFPGRARFHYGHPDVWDKLYIQARGGISKATRNLHVSEDVFGGLNAALRGGKIAYRDYISVGKGRDMGFVSINGFEIKISGGNGEVCVSRDLYRVATRFDFFRMLSVYYSGPGFFINNAILMTTVYLQTWVLVVLALAGAYLISSGTLREAEGIGLREDDQEGEEPAPDEEQETANRRLLMNADRNLLQDGYYGATEEEPVADEEEEEEVPEDAAAALGVNNEEEADQYYARFYNEESGGDGGGASSDYGGGGVDYDTGGYDYPDYPDGTADQTPSAPSSGRSGGPSPEAPQVERESSKEIKDLLARYNGTEAGLRDLDTSVGITSIVQLGMITIIAYIGELLLEMGVLQTLVIILVQVISGSLAFFIFKQQTDASAFVEDMTYGGARYVGTGREFALMHNPFVTLYVRYARTHFYFAYSLVLLCVLLAILDVPGYASATFGAWMVALSLLFAPFWFNPVQFVVNQTKSDYKQFNRWLQGEEPDPDSKQTWYTWHDRQMAKIRNENSNITDHSLNGLRSILWSFVINGLLWLAAISQVRTNDDLDHIQNLEDEIQDLENAMARARSSTVDDIDILVRQKNRIQDQLLREKGDHLGLSKKNFPKKFKSYLIVTLLLLATGAFLYLIFSCMKARGRQRGARIIRVMAGVGFILASCIMTMIPGFLLTKDDKNGWRNLMLIYYANLNLVIFIISFLEHTFFDRVSVRHLVDRAYFVLDNICSTILFAVLFLLSFIRIVSIIQNTLLYNVSVASSIQSRELVETIGIERLRQKKDDSEDGDNRDRTNQVSEALERLTDPNRSREGDMGASTREGSFTRGESISRKNLYRSRESAMSDRYGGVRTGSMDEHGASTSKYQYPKHS